MEKIEKGGVINEVILSGYIKHIIATTDLLEYNIICDGKTDLFIQIEKAKKVKLSVKVLNGGVCSLFLWNESGRDIHLIEHYEIEKDAQLKMAYGDCEEHKTEREMIVDLKEEGASAIVKSSILAQAEKETKMVCTSYAPYTSCTMENYSVVTRDGVYHMEATGAVKKGAHGSQSHQTSRALTIKENPKATILPQLLIDENDVNASHATSIGQIDENQMIYLQSRGLNKDQVMSLITMGYLLPIAQFLDQEELKEQLTKKIESKVMNACWT